MIPIAVWRLRRQANRYERIHSSGSGGGRRIGYVEAGTAGLLRVFRRCLATDQGLGLPAGEDVVTVSTYTGSATIRTSVLGTNAEIKS